FTLSGGALIPNLRLLSSAHINHRGVESLDLRSRFAMSGSINVLIAPFSPWLLPHRLNTCSLSVWLCTPFSAKKLSRRYISPAAEYQMLGASIGRNDSVPLFQQSIIRSAYNTFSVSLPSNPKAFAR